MIQTIFSKAARKALVAWETDLTAEELIQELWVWYLESPAIQNRIDGLVEGEAVLYVRRQALNILAGKALANDMFNGRRTYSSDSVREALEGTSTNRYLVDILPLAMRELDKQNDGRYAEAIRSRYEDGIVPPKKGGGAMLLARAVRGLTEHVNVITITAGVDADGKNTEGPGSRHSVFPDTRPTSGGHSDPTADIAILLIEHPELRDEYLYESPISEFLGGRCHA
ncbi:helix-turn-helix DNA-binding domain protein [Mycobacterium phage XianYue]|nr:helix-turn-helix DNA-binding domain protein [Mycobacterium phage XianYue]